MTRNGQESYALRILEERFESEMITQRQASLLAGAYESLRQPLKEVRVLVYYIDRFNITNSGEHVRLLQAIGRLIEQQPEHRQTLETTARVLLNKMRDSREFMSFGSKFLIQNQLFELAKLYSQRLLELSETPRQQIQALLRLQEISAELEQYEEQHGFLLQLLEIDENKVRTLYMLAKVNYHKLYNSNAALNYLTRLFTHDPTDYYKSRAYSLQIRIYFSLQENDLAYDVAQEARLEFPRDTVILSLYENAVRRNQSDPF
jgi:tetratricopeptide (TPR) repeat protein